MPTPGTPEDTFRFNQIVAKTLAIEGSKVYSNAATGEYSRYGITLEFLRGIRPTAEADEIINMTAEGASRLYREFFWTPTGMWRLLDDAVAFRTFDLGVNCGPGTSVRLLQRSLSSLDWPIRVDGVLGPMTAETANKTNPGLLLMTLKKHAAARYKLLADKSQANAASFVGWIARLERGL